MRFLSAFLAGLFSLLLWMIHPDPVFGMHPRLLSGNSKLNLRHPVLLVGFKGGINFSVVSPTLRFSVFQGINGDGTTGYKNYDAFYKNMGYQYGFIGMIELSPLINLSLEPSFSSYSIKYSALSSWSDASSTINHLEINTDFIDRLKYFEIPLIIRYKLASGKIRPFLSAGFFYGMMTGSQSQVHSTTTQYLGDLETELESSTAGYDNSDNFIQTRLAVFPGAGFFYDFSFMTIFAEASYIFGLNNIVSESARYSNQQIVGSNYNVPDNLRFDNPTVNIGLLFNINRRGEGQAVDCPTFKKRK
jgi:hypothetical protein